MKVFKVYHMPNACKKNIKPIDMDEVEDLMSNLISLGVNPYAHKFVVCDSRSILPGDQEANEAFMNMDFLRKVAETEEFKPFVLPSNEDINKAKVIKLAYDYLHNQHKQGHAATLDGVHIAMNNLLSSIQKEVEKSKDPVLADFIFNFDRINEDLVQLNVPSLFSKSMPSKQRLSPIVLEIEASKFIRDKYPADFKVSDIEEIINIAKDFKQKHRIGVPEAELEEIFFQIVPLK